jgi:chromosome segregation ATPase
VQATVLLIDGETSEGATESLRGLIERSVDGAHWQVVLCPDVETAQGYFAAQGASRRQPSLVVLNVDVRGGWPFCTHLKKVYPAVPVIVVSRRLSTEVFQSHQKLDSRADAYHRIPEELGGLAISLGYFGSHESEAGRGPETGRHKSRKAEAPSSRLDAAVAEQARALEDARRQIEALEAERDALADKSRRQVLELIATSQGSHVGALQERLVSLEAELARTRSALEAAERTHEDDRRGWAETHSQLERELKALEERGRSGVLASSLDAVEAVRAEARLEAASAAEQLAVVSVQLASLTAELKGAHERRLEAEARARAAEEQLAAGTPDTADGPLEEALDALKVRLDTAERAYATASQHREQLEAALATSRAEAMSLQADKQALDEALATSRRLMREYAAESARKTEVLNEVDARVAQVEREGREAFAALEAALHREQGRVEALEADLAAARAQAVNPEVDQIIPELEAEIAELGTELSVAIEKSAALAAQNEQLRGELQARLDGGARHEETLRAQQERLVQLESDLLAAEARSARLDAESQSRLERLNKLQSELTLHAERTLGAERARAETSVSLADLRSALEASRQRQAELEERLDAMTQRATVAEASRLADESVLSFRQDELAAAEARHASLEAHLALVAARFEAIVAYAKRVENRLVSAEGTRIAAEFQLERLLAEVRAAAQVGEIPPPFELPPR